MVKRPHSGLGLPAKLLEVAAPEGSRHAEDHDEWLLDEALAESFPASDSIAVSPYSPASDKPA